VPACARVPLSETDFFFRGGGVVLFCACGFFGVFLRAYMPMYAPPLYVMRDLRKSLLIVRYNGFSAYSDRKRRGIASARAN